MKIFIDPGHNYSGEDTGAVGYGLKEQDVTFKISEQLKNLLVNAGHEVKMSRNSLTDNVSDPSLSNRAAMANNFGAYLFVSIHCNAASASSAKGTEIFIRKGESSKKSSWGYAEHIVSAISAKLGLVKRGAHNGVKFPPEGFAVLTRTNMRAVLVETAFITNQHENNLLRNNWADFAQAIFEGITKAMAEDPNVTDSVQQQQLLNFTSTYNYGLLHSTSQNWLLDVRNMNGTPFDRPEPIMEKACLTNLEEYRDGIKLVFKDANNKFNCNGVFLTFGEYVDLSTTPYLLQIEAPLGLVGNIELKGVLYKEGIITTTEIKSYQWYEEKPDASDIDAGAGWIKIDGATTNLLKINNSNNQKKYKLIVFYGENGSISQVIDTNPAKGYIQTENDNKVYYYEEESQQIEEPVVYSLQRAKAIAPEDITEKCYYYDPQGNLVDGFDTDNAYLTIKYERDGNIYTTVWYPSAFDSSIGFIGDELYHYNANGDISAKIANTEHILEIKIPDKEKSFVSAKWQMSSNDSSENGQWFEIGKKYYPENSMFKYVWVDQDYNLHYYIKDVYSIGNWNNTFRLSVTTSENTDIRTLKEIYFVQDGQQGTNGTDYCCIVRPVAADGVTPLNDNEAILSKTEPLCLKACVYKNGKRIKYSSCSWSTMAQCLKITDKSTHCVISHNENLINPSYHFVTAEVTVEGNKIYFNYPIVYYNDIQKPVCFELSYPKYIEYTASGYAPKWLDKELICNYQGQGTSVFEVYQSEEQKAPLLSLEQNKIVPISTFNFDTGIGVLKVGELYCPVMMYLNIFGNEAINSWDGTSIKLDDKNGAVLAPQVGAGKKEENLFTGVVMGKDPSQDKVGLYGYNKGVASFGLMENGNAFFGKNKEVIFDVENKTYTIGGWEVAKDQEKDENGKEKEDENGNPIYLDSDKLTGGNTILHSKNGIITNKMEIHSFEANEEDPVQEKEVQGYIGYNAGNDGTGATDTLGITSDTNSIVIETGKNIRLTCTEKEQQGSIYIQPNEKGSIYIKHGADDEHPIDLIQQLNNITDNISRLWAWIESQKEPN